MNDLGEVLITARRARGITQEELAELAGVTQAALSRYENFLRVPEPEVVDRLAQALGVTVPFLHSAGRLRGAMAMDAHMRRRKTARATDWKQLEAKLNMYRMHARYLFEEVSLRAEQEIPRFDPVVTDPEHAAGLVRMQWRMPVGPVRQLVRWLESAGCVVIEEDFGTARVDGLSQWIGEHPVLLVNARIPTDRKRHTLAHELGHLCLHSTEVTEDMERESDLFAAEFLMPMSSIRPQLRNISMGRLLDLKREWGTSLQSIVERAYRGDLVTASQRTNFYKAFSSRGWRKQEPLSEELPPEHPELLRRIGATLADRGLGPEEINTMTGFSGSGEDHPFLPARRSLRVV